MKKITLSILFSLLATVAFSQMTKADAQGFLTRNPLEKAAGVVIWEGGEKSTYSKENLESMKALESGFSLNVTQNGASREKFYPYAAIKIISTNSVGELVITMRN